MRGSPGAGRTAERSSRARKGLRALGRRLRFVRGAPTYAPAGDLAVVTTYFNPSG